jgi:RNA polymerase sigma-70 factor (ECF subfamily)
MAASDRSRSEEQPSDEQLIAAALAGDDHAYTQLAGRHKSRVFGLASRIARSPSDLDDICQDVFVQAFSKLGQFRGNSPFEHWLLRIATFKCYDYLRRRRRDRDRVSIDALLESGYEPVAPRDSADDPELQRLHEALGRLPAKERVVITLLELENHSVQEVADLTGWSVSNVKVRAFRARLTLRKLLQKMP